MSGHDDEERPIDRSLIDAAMPGLEPSAAQRARLKRAVAGAIAAGAVTGVAATAQAATGTATASASAASAGGVAGASAAATTTVVGVGLGVKTVAVAVAIASVVGVVAISTRTPPATDPVTEAPRARAGTTEAVEPPHRAPPSAAPAPRAATAAPTRPSEPSAVETVRPSPSPSSTSAVPRREIVAARPPTPEPPPSVDDEVDPAVAETMLLSRARVALRRHDGTSAMQLLQEHAARFPEGELREERLALRVSALCELGQTERAHLEAVAYLDVFPGSIHAADVRAADCWTAR